MTMASTLRCDCYLAIFVLLLLLHLPGSKAFGFPRAKISGTSASKESRIIPPDQDLTALIRLEPVDQTGIYTNAVQLLSSMQDSPSCNRLATSTLLDSCHSIDSSNHNAEASLEDVRSVYAAQLAMCEIESAGSAVPQTCKSLGIPHQMKGFKSIRRDQLGLCLQSLESKPQWWISYSNSKQNAVVMCQAARVDIEKDELIKLHKSMVETNANANEALSRANKEANDGLSQLRSNFALAVRMFQDQMAHDIEASATQTQSFFEKLVNAMDVAVQSMLSKTSSTLRGMDSDANTLSKNVRKANTDSANLEKNIGRLFQQVVTGSAELAAAQTEQWDLSRSIATDLQGSLQTMQEGDIVSLLGALASIRGQVQSSNEIITFMYLRQNELYERVQDLDSSFSNIESKAETFQAVQSRQAELQARLHNQTQVEMQASRSIIANVTSSARGLHEAVDHAAAKLANMAWYGAIPKEILSLGWLAVAVAVLHRYSPAHGRSVAAFIALMILIHTSGMLNDFKKWILSSDLTLIHYASGYQIRLGTLIKLAAPLTLLLAMLVAVIIIINKRTNARKFSSSRIMRNKPSGLALMGLEVSERQHRQWSI